MNGVWSYSSTLEGPSVIIMSGVHGDEPCGVAAVNQLRGELEEGLLKIKRGSLTLIIANHEALEKSTRFVERNLNRLFKDNSGEKACREVQRAEEIKPILAVCDYFLDLHSTSTATVPFLICEQSEREIAAHLGIEHVVIGWAALGGSVSGDTEGWARAHGARALTLECGQHKEPEAEEVAYRAARNFLRLTGLLYAEMPEDFEPRVFEFYHCQVLNSKSFRYAREFVNFTPLAAGEIIGRDDQQQYVASCDSYMIFPGDPKDIDVGVELYLLTKELTS